MNDIDVSCEPSKKRPFCTSYGLRNWSDGRRFNMGEINREQFPTKVK